MPVWHHDFCNLHQQFSIIFVDAVCGIVLLQRIYSAVQRVQNGSVFTAHADLSSPFEIRRDQPPFPCKGVGKHSHLSSELFLDGIKR